MRQISSNTAFYTIFDVVNGHMDPSIPQLRYDLYRFKSGSLDDISDFEVCNFNGYAPVPAYGYAINPVGAGPNQEMHNTAHFEQTGVNSAGVIDLAYGLVCSDAAGSVWWWWEWGFSGPLQFVAVGNYVDFDIPWQAICDYP